MIGEEFMHLYWRVIEELKYLGENWTFRDPSLLRSFRIWMQKNAGAIALSVQGNRSSSAPFIGSKVLEQSLN